MTPQNNLCIIQPEDAPDVGVNVRVGPERIVLAAPRGDTEWGMFMFPSVWRLRDGRLVCAVTIGNDESPSNADYHYLWYLSDDDGAHWGHATPSPEEAEDLMRQRCTLRDGTQIYYRPRMVSLDAFDAEPVECDLPLLIEKGWRVFYRLGDLPEHGRHLRMFVRGGDEESWREEQAVMDEDILVPAFKETVLEHDAPVRPTHSAIATPLRALADYVGDDRPPSLGLRENVQTWPESRGVPRRRDVRIGMNIHRCSSGVSVDDLAGALPGDTVIRLLMPAPTAMRLHDQSCRPILQEPDGPLLATGFALHASSSLRVQSPNGAVDTRDCVPIFRSLDGGRVWRHHSAIPYNTINGYRVTQGHISPEMPAGNWMAMLRTTGGKTANSPLLLTRSYDQGQTWSDPQAIRPGSVNPNGGVLDNGVAYRLYGRPGQFITFCADGEGRQWGNDVTIVEPPRPSEPKNSCCNSAVCPIGPDRFIIVYTHYFHHDKQGTVRKAVLAREIITEPSG